MGIVEFVLFAILATDKPPFLWFNWPLCFAAHALTAALLVHNRLKLTDVRRDFDDEKLGEEYRGWLKTDRIQAGCCGVFAVAFWFLTRVWILPLYGAAVCGYVITGLALCWLVFAGKPIRDANSQRERIDEFVSQERPKPITAVA